MAGTSSSTCWSSSRGMTAQAQLVLARYGQACKTATEDLRNLSGCQTRREDGKVWKRKIICRQAVAGSSSRLGWSHAGDRERQQMDPGGS